MSIRAFVIPVRGGLRGALPPDSGLAAQQTLGPIRQGRSTEVVLLRCRSTPRCDRRARVCGKCWPAPRSCSGPIASPVRSLVDRGRRSRLMLNVSCLNADPVPPQLRYAKKAVAAPSVQCGSKEAARRRSASRCTGRAQRASVVRRRSAPVVRASLAPPASSGVSGPGALAGGAKRRGTRLPLGLRLAGVARRQH